MKLGVYPLGAGQDVGRSCIILTIGDKKIMLDCGLHMGMQDSKKFPDLVKLKKKYNNKPLDEIIDVVLISHFHLDHVGALPLMTEVIGYNGPILMTSPTKALLPYMLEDYSKVIIEASKDSGNYENKDKNYLSYTNAQITDCCSKVKSMNLQETVSVAGMKVKTYYAGHVLGACMFLIEYNGVKVVYTGDFNSNADRHLGAAWMDKCRPHLIITESTYATTARDSKKSRERDFLKEIQETTENGGKVLVPVFALGRAQELCILVETIWNRKNNKIPVYFSAGLIEKVQFFYKLFVNWTNQKIKSTFLYNNMFDFKHIQSFDRNLIKSPFPMVLFATPGMLHGGTSLQVFAEWCSDEKNTIIIPGYCVAGTLGNKLLKGVKNVNIDKKCYEVKMKVKNMSFSAHADSKGILNLIKHVEPQNVCLVHGEKGKMEIFTEVVKETLKIPCYYPANFEDLWLDVVPEDKPFPISLDERILSLLEVDRSVTMPLIVVKDPKSDGLIFKKDLTLKGRYKRIDAGDKSKEEKVTGSGKKITSEAMDEEDKRIEYIVLPHKIRRMSTAEYK